MRALIVEDDQTIAAFLAKGLKEGCSRVGGAIVRGFWGCPDSASNGSRARMAVRAGFGCGSSVADRGATRAAAAVDARAACGRVLGFGDHAIVTMILPL
jgi:hypothetical protein